MSLAAVGEAAIKLRAMGMDDDADAVLDLLGLYSDLYMEFNMLLDKRRTPTQSDGC